MTLSKFTHEIRNPVALIQSELQMLASAHPELNSYDGWYGIMENLEYIRELLNELSRYNNAEHLSPVQTDITLLLKSIIRSFRPALDLSLIHISCSTLSCSLRTLSGYQVFISANSFSCIFSLS